MATRRARLTVVREEFEEFCLTLDCLREIDPAAFERLRVAILQAFSELDSDGHGGGGLRGYIEVQDYPEFSYLLDQIPPGPKLRI
jgi:hypothetical protein